MLFQRSRMPKQKITKQIILDSAFELMRFSGHEAVNARSVAKSAGCSVQPIYSYYENMTELMQELFAYTQQFLSKYIEKMHHRNATLNQLASAISVLQKMRSIYFVFCIFQNI